MALSKIVPVNRCYASQPIPLMMKVPFQNPTYEVHVYNLREANDRQDAGPFWHLHEVRSPVAQEFRRANPGFFNPIKTEYENNLSSYVDELRMSVKGRKFDVITRAPSSRDDALPYLNAIKKEYPDVSDISSCFSKEDECKAGSASSLDDFLPSLSFNCQCDLGEYSSLLIVDDLLSGGITVSAMIYRLKEAGLNDDADISVAVPLVLQGVSDA